MKIRLHRVSCDVDGKYWYIPEIIFIKRTWYGFYKEWLTPYAINYKTLKTDHKLASINPHDKNKLKDFLQECLDWVNYYEHKRGWTLTSSYDEYKRIEYLKSDEYKELQEKTVKRIE